MTLKTILKNFLNYADTLEAQKKLGKDLYEVDFQKLKALTEQLKHDKDYASSEGLKEVNRRKNRYKDILPYDYTRVILSEYPGVPGSDFINANYIKGASGSLAYIASQGPLPNTVVDFWRMIWECEVQVIVMACNEQESGKYKCECYWPTDEEKKQYGNINIEFVKWRQVCPDFLVRTLKACWENEERVICQFHYTTWPDHGVPNSVQPILELVRLIRDCQASEAVPVLIHCSAGCGRTGTICAIDYVWGLMRMGKLSKQFNLYNVIADMRRQRIAMVQTKEQYVLVHKAVSSLFEQQLRVIDSHTYENLDEDGEPLILKELQEEDIYEDILEPVILGEKSGEWKVQPFKMIHECRPVSLEPAQVHQSGDAFSVPSPVVSTICNIEADSLIKTEDKHMNFGVSISDNVQLEQNINETNNEFESSSTIRNYNTLQKLCREESVKRLISGWNRAAEQTEDAKSGPKELIQKVENIIDIKSPTPIKVVNFEHSLSDQKLENLESKEKVMYATSNSKVDNFYISNEQPPLDKSVESTNISSKNTSFDDSYHSGKLIGKATVIRRPSIAKLKALFEKSSQEGHESERQRRPLFRSHSHHVSNSSRILTVSDTPDHQNSSSPSTDQSMHQTTQSACTNVQTSINCNQQSELSPTYWSQSSSQRQSHHFAESSGHRQKHHDRSDANEACNRTDHHCSKHYDVPPKSNDNGTENSADNDGFSSVARNEEIYKDTASLTPDTNNSQSSCTYHNISTKMKLKQSHSLGHRKDKAPELPAKRKPTFPNSQIPKNKSDSISMATASKENQWTQEKPNKSEQSEISGIKRTERLIKTFFKGASASQKHTHNVVSQSWSSPLDHVVKESRRNSHEAVLNVHSSTLYKTQSFSDPEQGDGRANELSRQAEKKISLSETSTPQPTSNKHTSSPYQDEGTYTNVNTLAERNIQQIEDKLKSHPRGAIIDLTSRKSYIDEMNLGSGKHFVFRNTIQPVKFSPALESQDLTSYNFKNRKKSENQCKESTETSTSHTSVPKTSVSKAEKTIKDSDLIDAKNLLLHSPPPKSKRNHASKTNSKSNPPLSSSSSSEMLEDKPTKSNQTPSTTHTNVLNSANSRNVQPSSNSTSTSSYAADRSDPRYFPVTRQTASEAKYECEKQKATSTGRETYGVTRPISSYEPLYSTKQASYAYHKAATNKYLPESYEKKPLTHMPIQGVKYSQESHLAQNAEKEPLYGLQRSASGPQVLPPECDGSQVAMASSDQSNLISSYHQHSDEIANKHHKPVARYEQNPSFGLYGTVGTPNPYPVGPPKPPRTFHYDSKTVENQYNTEQNIKRDSGRYLVSVASPKHSTSSTQQQQMAENQNAEYRYGERRQPDLSHHETNPVRQGYATSPPSEVPMSRSYPFSHYDSIYGHPRPYGKQFHPDSIEYRNVPVPSQVGNSIYGTVKDKSLNQQCLYGTIKHRNAAFSEYENVYGLHTGYKQAGKTSDGIYQSINPGHQRSKSEAYARSQKQPLYPPHNPDYSNLNNGGVNNLLTSPTRKVYFDTLQRRHKQRVTWEQRRSHDDMDIQSAQSSRLREQIHARRSMVELDNLEITVASDEGYPEKGFSNLSPLSPKVPPSANERLCETSQKRRSPNCASEFHKDSHLKKNSSHNKETGSFGETLSKAFGKLTSLTKFNSKDIQSGHGSTDSGGSGPKVVPPSKQKDKEKPSPNCMNQSPKKCRDPTSHSEQWTQV